MDFSRALQLLKKGARITRKGWDFHLTFDGHALRRTFATTGAPAHDSDDLYNVLHVFNIFADDWEVVPGPNDVHAKAQMFDRSFLVTSNMGASTKEFFFDLLISENGTVAKNGVLLGHDPELYRRLRAVLECTGYDEPDEPETPSRFQREDLL